LRRVPVSLRFQSSKPNRWGEKSEICRSHRLKLSEQFGGAFEISYVSFGQRHHDLLATAVGPRPDEKGECFEYFEPSIHSGEPLLNHGSEAFRRREFGRQRCASCLDELLFKRR
jgi:hypothetical protein